MKGIPPLFEGFNVISTSSRKRDVMWHSYLEFFLANIVVIFFLKRLKAERNFHLYFQGEKNSRRVSSGKDIKYDLTDFPWRSSFLVSKEDLFFGGDLLGALNALFFCSFGRF